MHGYRVPADTIAFPNWVKATVVHQHKIITHVTYYTLKTHVYRMIVYLSYMGNLRQYETTQTQIMITIKYVVVQENTFLQQGIYKILGECKIIVNTNYGFTITYHTEKL